MQTNHTVVRDNLDISYTEEARIIEKMKLINMLTPEKQAIMVIENRDLFKWIIEPEEVVVAAMKFSEL